MTNEEAVDVLETIAEIYPKFEMTRKKAKLMLPPLKEMDYEGVMEKLSDFVAKYPYAPTIAEIAAYPSKQNEHVERLKKWRAEASQVPPHIKDRFRNAMQQLIMEKSES